MENRVSLEGSPTKNKTAEVIGLWVLIMVGVGMAWVSWLKWCDPIIDFGRELYIPWALCQGKILYKDINMFFYGPLSYYLNALFFAIFGTHINTIIGFNLVFICLMAFLLYKITKAASNAVCAFFSVLSFIILFAFPRYFPILNDNFVTPYSHAATHGITLSLLALYLVSKYLSTRRMAYACLAWFICGLVLLTKVELFLGLFTAMILAWVLMYRAECPTAKVMLAHFTVCSALLVLPLLLAGVYIAQSSAFPAAISHILNPYFLIFHKGHSFSHLLTNIMGTDQPLANANRMFFWLGIYLLVGLIIIGANHFLYALRRKTKSFLLPAVLGGLMTIPVIYATMRGGLPYLDYFLPLPLITISYIIYCLAKLRKSEQHSAEWCKDISSLSFSVFALVLLVRLFFNARIIHYGFFLALPGYLILLRLFFDRLPALMKRVSGSATIGMIPIAVLSLCVLWSYFDRSLGLYRIINYPIKSGSEVIKTFDPNLAETGSVIQESINMIEGVVGQGKTMTAFPEGLMFNYLTRTQSASPYTAFLPTFFAVFGDTILESLQERPPDFVLLVERSTPEHGYAYFGVDYAAEVVQWIRKNYVEISQFGEKPFSGQGFGIVIMKRIPF
jgi:4-amino-4-deoxy-L-arabinose transferase-like glycosyltransferase